MNLTLLAISVIAVYLAAYFVYGRYVSRQLGLSGETKTPAVRFNDGNDFVPTSPFVLLGQHFSAIAAVGPIAGPILAGVQYGWMWGLIWIVVGAVFIGSVHDLTALVISIRHDGRSIGDVMKDYLGPKAALIFSVYIWVSLIYVIIVFTDLTAGAFVNRPEWGGANFGPGVATSSLLYLGLAILLGLCFTRLKMSLTVATVLFVPAIFLIIWFGQKIPIVFPGDAMTQQRLWDVAILVYCFFASIIPVSVLLQPRGFLGGFILYATFVVGLVGIFFSHTPISMPRGSFSLTGAASGAMPIFPLLFTTIACGACSGFHGLVSSGTTSKQIRKETDAKLVGFGGMLLESLVAVIALATFMILKPGSPEAQMGPDEIYARGLAHFMGVFGISFAAGVTFGKLAFATFIYDTLDVSTRLGRYVFQEITGVKGRAGAILGTLATLLVPTIAVFMTFHDASGNPIPLWKMVWPVFGASNQLLAALTLTGVTIWLKRERRNYWIVGIPATFMVIVTLYSLGKTLASRWTSDSLILNFTNPIVVTSIVLIVLSFVFLGTALRHFSDKEKFHA